ncbi:hypothetical protein DL96DRAFT_454873 [Flagelloscypha sp. PMI_526]|nr:hypothetical protein DL96DRAFT_454873 [Flagelloscypha sp. PMI_526]
MAGGKGRLGTYFDVTSFLPPRLNIMVKPVRCRYFDHDGKTIGGGCLNAHCHFAHPSDKEWSTLPRTQQFILDDVIAGRSFKKSSRRRTPPPRSRSFYSPPPRSSSSRSHSRHVLLRVIGLRLPAQTDDGLQTNPAAQFRLFPVPLETPESYH